MKNRFDFHNIFWIILVCLLPILALFVLAGMGIYISGWLFIGLLLLCFVFLHFLFRDKATPENSDDQERETDKLKEIELKQPFLDSFQAKHAFEHDKNIFYEGTLLVKADIAYQKLKQQFQDSGYTPMLQETESSGTMLALISHPAQPALRSVSKPAINLILFLLTMVTTTWAGAAHQGVNLWQEPGRFSLSLPYALALMAILGVHELGHYFMAKRHGIQVTLPYFIPVSFALGTFGAFISMKSPVEDRRALFDVGIAGPLWQGWLSPSLRY